MIQNGADNSMRYLIQQLDGMSLGVLAVLLAMSIISWSIFLYKSFDLLRKRQQLQAVLKKIKNVTLLSELHAIATVHRDTLPGIFIADNLAFLDQLKKGERTVHAWDLMVHNLEQTFDAMIAHEESLFFFLSTSASLAPLLGLLGTVWGLVQAFIGISQQHSADIAAVAPGISQALLTTIAGLLVAIPAVAMYNCLLVQIRSIEQLLSQISDRIHFVARHLLL